MTDIRIGQCVWCTVQYSFLFLFLLPNGMDGDGWRCLKLKKEYACVP